MTLAVAWLAFPIALGLVCFGCGLLLEEVLRRRLPVLLLMPMGFAAVIVLVQLATISDATAELGVPAAIAAAAAGFGLSYPWGRIDPWAVLAPLLAYAAYAAPVALSGDATFAGYIKLDDTATWFALTDRVMEHGRSIEGLAPSSYEATLAFNLADGYPVGAFLPLGVGRAIVGQDVAWVFQPYLAFAGAMVAASLYVLAGAVLRPGPMRMLAAAVAAVPALLFGYVLWGGVKEVVAAALVTLMAALLAVSLTEEEGPADRDLALIAVASAATIAVLSASGGVWLLGLLLPAAIVVARRHGARLAIRAGALVAVCAGALSAPLIAAGGFVPPTSSPVTSDTAKGNLVEPLSWLQVFGVWPRGDFRYEPQNMPATYLLIAAVALLALAGVALAWRRRAHGVLIFVCGTAAACAAIVLVGSPWVEAKALATASPAIVFAALVGAGAAGSVAPQILGVLAAVVVCGGVAWSNALAYHDVNLAPRDRHAELERIGERIAGQGPALMTEYEPYGVRHFLRKADPEGASELRRRQVPLRAGGTLRKLGTADIDEFQLDGIRAYRTLVLRRSPVASRPPSVYRLISRGRFYDVWQLVPGLQDSLLEHEPLGSRGSPAGRPACRRVRALARRAAAAGARLAVSRVPPAVRMDLFAGSVGSGGTRAVPRTPGAVYPGRRARFADTVRVPEGGAHQIYVAGAFRRQVEVSIDGRRVSRERHRLNHAGYYEPLGETELTAGSHRIDVRYRPLPVAPGDGGPAFPFGPLYVVQSSSPRVELVPPARARRLCGQRLDWIESVAR
jgi:hypothetical protein